MTVFYAGLIHESKGLEYMINAVRGLTDIKLIIAGKIEDEVAQKTRIVDSNARMIDYIGLIPYEQVIEKTVEAERARRSKDFQQ
jgi:glycosyltransferase involved in cell wall biosynthesis